MSSELPDIIKQEDQEREQAVIDKGRIKNLKEGDQYVFDVQMDPKLLTSKTLKLLQKESNYRVEWCNRMANFITRLLREVLCSGIGHLGLFLISGLRTFNLSKKFHFYTCFKEHPFVSKIIIWVNICLK